MNVYAHALSLTAVTVYVSYGVQLLFYPTYDETFQQGIIPHHK